MSIHGTALAFSYPSGPPVLQGVDARIESGKITAIVGPNGAGKSTLLRLLAGLARPSSGDVRINTIPMNDLNHTQRARSLAFIAQRSSLAFDFDVRKVISFGRLVQDSDRHAVDRAIERFGLTELASTPMGAISVGQQQRVSLARVWAQLDGTDDAYVCADEPTSAMDPRYQLDTLDAFKELAGRGIGVAMVAHDLTLAARYADSVVLMTAQGSVLKQGATREMLVPDKLSKVFDTGFAVGEIDGHPAMIPTGNAGFEAKTLIE
ncbi:MAG: ABC transporter ATP-binding protein [Phycisphaerales bacterium]